LQLLGLLELLFVLESIPQIRLLRRGSGGSTIDVIDCYRVQAMVAIY
jgi:hypothetical protein